jgi:hypothetical protein
MDKESSMSRKMYLVFVVVALLSLVLTACQDEGSKSSNSSSTQPVTLKQITEEQNKSVTACKAGEVKGTDGVCKRQVAAPKTEPKTMDEINKYCNGDVN